MVRPPRLGVALAAAVSVPALCFAAATPAETVAAMDVPVIFGGPPDPGQVDGTSLESPGSREGMFGVFDGLGAIEPRNGDSFGVLSTGHVDDLPGFEDTDWGEEGEKGDAATLSFEILAPPDSASLWFDWYFLTREFPVEYEGFADTFGAIVRNESGVLEIVFDAKGQPINPLSSSIIVEGEPLEGTGFDGFGGTDWWSTGTPITAGQSLRLTFGIHDVGDGNFDSAVLLDHLRFMPDVLDGPVSFPADEIPGDDDDATSDDDDATEDDDDTTEDDDDATVDDDDVTVDDDDSAPIGPGGITGSGDCGCLTARSSTPPWFAALGLLALLQRRRRAHS